VSTTLYLVRHGAHDRLGRMLCGRMDGVGLGEAGRAQAAAVAERLAREPIAAVYASPLERAQETARPLAERLGEPVETLEGVVEIDFGAWTGKRFDELEPDPAWQAWNAERGLHRPPGGESMAEAQVRAVRAVEAVRRRHPDQAVAVFSHADVIKGLVCHWLGLTLDFYRRFDIDPASITAALVGDWGAKVLKLNEGVRP
jgi:probable phosphoglycerate mutase